MTSPSTVWTVGHSNHSAEKFLSILRAHRIEVVADVRRFPGSRKHPHFGGEALAAGLAAHGIDYAWLNRLGGRRRGDAGPQHSGWRNASFRAYAAYTWSDEFADGLDELLHIASAARTAVMCSELLWWRCHRRLVSDVLKFVGVEVIHLAGEGAGSIHEFTPPACVSAHELTYPPEDCCDSH